MYSSNGDQRSGQLKVVCGRLIHAVLENRPEWDAMGFVNGWWVLLSFPTGSKALCSL